MYVLIALVLILGFVYLVVHSIERELVRPPPRSVLNDREDGDY
jgi:hypothetical protein